MQHFHPDQPAERPDQRPIPAETAAARAIQAFDPRFGRDARPVTFVRDRKVPNCLGVTGLFKLTNVHSRADLLYVAEDRPEPAHKPEHQLVSGLFVEFLEDGPLDRAKGEILRGHPANAKQPTNGERFGKIDLQRRTKDVFGPPRYRYGMVFAEVESVQIPGDQHYLYLKQEIR